MSRPRVNAKFESDLTPEELHARAAEAVAACKPILKGYTSEELGYILAELIAIWLGGNLALREGSDTDIDPVDTAKLRNDLLKVCIETSHRLMQEYYDASKAPPQ